MNGCKYIYVITAVICVYIYIYIYRYRYGALHRIHMYVPIYCSAKNKEVIGSKCKK